VEDQGPGFTEDDMQKVFGKFQKLSAKPTRGESSTGLGLSIVKNLTELMGGKVNLHSEAGKGSRFVLVFNVKNKELHLH
jgi:signal transduction histidine kinase